MDPAEALPRVEWDQPSEERRISARTLLTVAGLLVLTVLFLRAYVTYEPPHTIGYELLTYEINRLEWLWIASLWVSVVYVGGSLASHPKRALNILRRFRKRPVTLAAAIVAFTIFLAGTIGPLLLPQPAVNIPYRNQPPVFTSVPRDIVLNCYNPVGDRCYGTWGHPLGTGKFGEGLLRLVVFGARNVVQLTLVAVMLIVPLATLVGTVSAYTGGRVDRVLTGVAESLKAIPALLVFFVWRWVSDEGTLFMLVVAFGLVNWGSVATVVRSRALDEVAKDYVRAARASGASSAQIVRWHLIPNVARTAATTAVYQVPLFITIEATLSYLEFGSPATPLLLTPTSFKSWGTMIGENISSAGVYWWRVAIPIAALFVTIISVSILANGLQDVLDPR